MNALSVVLLFSLSQTSSDMYNQGNRSYTQGDFHEAVQTYEDAAEQVASARLYYNLGNAYFKTGRIGMAIISYRRARFLSPRDPDIEHNLAYTRNYRIDKEQSAGSPITAVISAVFHLLSMMEAQIAATILFVMSSIIVSLYIIKRKNAFGYTAIAVFVLFTLAFVSWQVWVSEKNARNAVIVVPEVNALSGPGDTYKNILVLHDGAEVRIREVRQDYVLIQLPGGLGGWIEKGSLEEVY